MDIRAISGGVLRVGTEIYNKGGVMASDVNWSITLDGGVILLGKTTTGEILGILPGESAAIQSGPILGFGKISVIVTADIDDGLSDMRSQGGFVFLFYAYVNPGGG